MPTATWKSRLRSGNAHCDLQLAVEVRQCPLGSGARGGGPAVPTGIWTARRRRRVRRRRRRRWRRGRRRRRRTALIKSNNPHLAGGEKHDCTEEFMPLGKCLKIDGKSPFLFWRFRNSCSLQNGYVRRIFHFQTHPSNDKRGQTFQFCTLEVMRRGQKMDATVKFIAI